MRLRNSLLALAVLLAPLGAWAQKDTLRLSSLFTTHLIFSTDVVYADNSNPKTVAARPIEKNMNVIALKAREPFDTPSSVSVLESGGRMWTYIVVFDDHPDELIIDMRGPQGGVSQAQGGDKGKAGVKGSGDLASNWKRGDAPVLSEVAAMPRELFHIGTKGYDIKAACVNIYSYSDITYVVLSLENGSGISYNIVDATFVIESRKSTKRTVKYDDPVFPRSKWGSLAAAPGGSATMVYSFDKLTLSKDQVLRVYLYEDVGQRNLVMTIDATDLNKAASLH